jgi:Trk K+ transport system NAD-binding subunit
MPPREPTIVVVGGDQLALSTARELTMLPGQHVVVLWQADADFERAIQAVGASFISGRPDSREGLDAAGVKEASTILALSQNDQLNLQTSLRARDANPKIRIVLRQFNRTLAAKIEQNLENCSVLSLAWHSAATYAAAALDPTCFHGLQFPEPDGPLTGFVTRVADDDDLAGRRPAEAEHALGARIIAIDGAIDFARDDPIAPGARLVVYGMLDTLLDSAPRQLLHQRATSWLFGRVRRRWRPGNIRWSRIDPIFGRLTVVAALLIALGVWYFHDAFASKSVDWLGALFFVLTTMTTNGYTGELIPDLKHPIDLVGAMLLMLSGTVISGIFIAFASSRLTRAQWVRMQGLRPINRHGHIVVCGAGSIGTGVIDLLLKFDKPLVVVEQRPDASLVERARDRGFDLLTGDASREDTLELCNLRAAHSLIALTNVDTLNLEIALGARVRNPDMPIILRVAEAAFAASIARHFQLETTFSVAALAGPVFAGLAHVEGARGRISFDGQEFGVAELVLDDDTRRYLPPAMIPLATGMEDGEFRLIRDVDEFGPGARALMLVPLAKVRENPEPFLAAAEAAAEAERALAQAASSHQIGV